MANKRKRPTKRKLLTFEFKGRPRRALLWWKETYETWFLFARVHQDEGGKLPREFGNLRDFKSFEEWWAHPKYGFELFCEPEHEDLVRKADGRTKLDDSSVLLKVKVNADRELILRDFETLLKRIHREETYQSQAAFQPTLPQQQLKLKKLQAALDAYQTSKTMVHRRAIHRLYRKTPAEQPRYVRKRIAVRKETGEKIYDQHGHYTPVYKTVYQNRLVREPNELYDRWVHNKMRLLSRQRALVRSCFFGVEYGVFPM